MEMYFCKVLILFIFTKLIATGAMSGAILICSRKTVTSSGTAAKLGLPTGYVQHHLVFARARWTS